jgi:hypothetical protein
MDMKFGRGGTYYSNSENLVTTIPDGARWISKHISEIATFKDLPAGQIDIRPTIQAPTTPFSIGAHLDVMMCKAGGRGTLVLRLDDGYVDQYTDLFPLLVARGLRASFYVKMTSVVANVGAFMSVPNMLAMDAAGMDFGCDSTSDDTAIVNKPSLAAAMADLLSVRDWHTSLGIVRARDHIVWAAGAHESSTRFNVASVTSDGADQSNLGFGAASSAAVGMLAIGSNVPPNTRVISAPDSTHVQVDKMIPVQTKPMRFVDDSSPFYGPKIPDACRALGFKTGLTVNPGPEYTRFGVADKSMHLNSNSLVGTDTVAAKLAELDLAIQRGSTLFVFSHHVNDGFDWPTYLDGVKARENAGQLDVLTVSEWWNRDGANPAQLPF